MSLSLFSSKTFVTLLLAAVSVRAVAQHISEPAASTNVGAPIANQQGFSTIRDLQQIQSQGHSGSYSFQNVYSAEGLTMQQPSAYQRNALHAQSLNIHVNLAVAQLGCDDFNNTVLELGKTFRSGIGAYGNSAQEAKMHFYSQVRDALKMRFADNDGMEVRARIEESFLMMMDATASLDEAVPSSFAFISQLANSVQNHYLDFVGRKGWGARMGCGNAPTQTEMHARAPAKKAPATKSEAPAKRGDSVSDIESIRQELRLGHGSGHGSRSPGASGVSSSSGLVEARREALAVEAELEAAFAAKKKAEVEALAKAEADAKAALVVKAKEDADAKVALDLKAKQEADAKLVADRKAKEEADAAAKLVDDEAKKVAEKKVADSTPSVAKPEVKKEEHKAEPVEITKPEDSPPLKIPEPVVARAPAPLPSAKPSKTPAPKVAPVAVYEAAEPGRTPRRRFSPVVVDHDVSEDTEDVVVQKPVQKAPVSKPAPAKKDSSLLTKFGDQGVPRAALKEALESWEKNKSNGKVRDDRYVVVMDLTRKATEKRFWVLDTESGKVVRSSFVGHGAGDGLGTSSSKEKLFYVSNKPGSNASTWGAMLVEGPDRDSALPNAIRLEGIDIHNRNMGKGQREIKIHSADYFSRPKGSSLNTPPNNAGRSSGCPVLYPEDAKWLSSSVPAGSFMYAYKGDIPVVSDNSAARRAVASFK